MMNKTHYTVGLATSLAVICPQTFEECALAVITGSIGGVLADIDLLFNDSQSDTLVNHLTAPATALLAFVADLLFNLGICQAIADQPTRSMLGIALFTALWFIGFFSKHRTFTHSLLGAAAFIAVMWVIHPPFILGFAAAYGSHLLLDVTNKRKLQLLFPFRVGVCFNLCYADGKANNILMKSGWMATAVLLTIGLIRSVLHVL